LPASQLTYTINTGGKVSAKYGRRYITDTIKGHSLCRSRVPIITEEMPRRAKEINNCIGITLE